MKGEDAVGPQPHEADPFDGLLMALPWGVDDDLALFFGEPESLGDAAVPLHRPAPEHTFGERDARMSGLLNVPLQGATGLYESAYLVKLTPETTAAMKAGYQTIRGASGNLGALRDPATGKIAKSVEWTEAGSLATTAAALGNAVTMAMIQYQLNMISDQLRRLDEQVNRMAELQQIDRDAELAASANSVRRLELQAQEAGAVTDHMMNQATGASSRLEKHIQRLLDSSRMRLRALKVGADPEERLEWMETDGRGALRDIWHLMQATRAWAVAQQLHAWHMLADPDQSPESAEANRQAAEQLLRQTRRELEQQTTAAKELGYALWRIAEFADKTSKTATLKENLFDTPEAERAAAQAGGIASYLKQELESLGLALPRLPEFPETAAMGQAGAEARATKWKPLLALLIDPDERLDLMIHGNGVGGHGNLSEGASVLLLTNRRLLGIRLTEFVKKGRVRVCEPRPPRLKAEYADSWGDAQVRISLKSGVFETKLAGVTIDIGVGSDQEARRIARRIQEPIPAGPAMGPDFAALLHRTHQQNRLPE